MYSRVEVIIGIVTGAVFEGHKLKIVTYLIEIYGIIYGDRLQNGRNEVLMKNI